MVLDPKNHALLAGQQKAQLERLRLNNVPRFLFRVFHPKSGGGLPHALNNPNLIVPHAYMTHEEVPAFYQTPESSLYSLAHNHYTCRNDTKSCFSSWSASLHLVLCYATSLGEGAYVAVLDRDNVDGDVLVWHVPHLLEFKGEGGCHGFLAHGIIKGCGYAAVSLSVLRDNGLVTVYPELLDIPLRVGTGLNFGGSIRLKMFSDRKGVPKTKDMEYLSAIAKPFGTLYFPVVTALLCLRAWPWFHRNIDHGRSAPSSKELARILRSLHITEKPSWLESDLPWLQYRAVVSGLGFPDVRQWLDLLHAIADQTLLLSESNCADMSELDAGNVEEDVHKRKLSEEDITDEGAEKRPVKRRAR